MKFEVPCSREDFLLQSLTTAFVNRIIAFTLLILLIAANIFHKIFRGSFAVFGALDMLLYTALLWRVLAPIVSAVRFAGQAERIPLTYVFSDQALEVHNHLRPDAPTIETYPYDRLVCDADEEFLIIEDDRCLRIHICTEDISHFHLKEILARIPQAQAR